MKKYHRRAIKIAKLLQITPFVRAVFLTGSLAQGKATEKSDIDFFIITQPGKIWTARAFATILVSLTGLRRHGKYIAGRICLNCYQTEDNLKIKPENRYTASDYSKAKLLWVTGDIYAKYLKANTWMTDKFGFKFRVSRPAMKTSKVLTVIQKIGEAIFNSSWLESNLRNYQSNRILHDPRTQNSPKGKIHISDKELRFHPIKNLDK